MCACFHKRHNINCALSRKKCEANQGLGLVSSEATFGGGGPAAFMCVVLLCTISSYCPHGKKNQDGGKNESQSQDLVSPPLSFLSPRTCAKRRGLPHYTETVTKRPLLRICCHAGGEGWKMKRKIRNRR